MTKYTAAFSNGTVITRSSERAYTHAWAAFDANNQRITRYAGASGFSATETLAHKAAAACLRRLANTAARAEVVKASA